MNSFKFMITLSKAFALTKMINGYIPKKKKNHKACIDVLNYRIHRYTLSQYAYWNI